MIKRRPFFLSGLAAKLVKLLPILALVMTSACYARASPYYYGPSHYSRGGHYRAPPSRHYYAPRHHGHHHGHGHGRHRGHDRHHGHHDH